VHSRGSSLIYQPQHYEYCDDYCRDDEEEREHALLYRTLKVWRKAPWFGLRGLCAYSAEIATDSGANRHALRRKSAVREVGAKRRWDFVHSLSVV